MKINTETVAVALFLLLWLPVILYVGVRKELKECQEWSERAFNELTPYKKRMLEEEWLDKQSILEELDRGYSR